MDGVTTARALVSEQFPNAQVALLAGSAARGKATSTSDLDIVVVLDGPPAPYRETLRYHGWPVELFVHTPDSLGLWWRRDAEHRRNTLAHMCAYGLILIDTGQAEQVRRAAADWLAAGPPALGQAEAEARRYAVTDALDDLADTSDEDERDAVAALVLNWVAELALLTQRQWLGRGKWLVRRLREVDQPLAERLLAAHRRAVGQGDVADLLTVGEAVLARAGGRLTEGFRIG
jgi:hypothetical protein